MTTFLFRDDHAYGLMYTYLPSNTHNHIIMRITITNTQTPALHNWDVEFFNILYCALLSPITLSRLIVLVLVLLGINHGVGVFNHDMI